MVSPAATAAPRTFWPRWQARALPGITGALAGLALFLLTHQYLATFGISRPVTAALTLAIGLGAWVGLSLAAGARRRAQTHWIEPTAWLTLAVWTVGFVWMLSGGRSLIGLVPLGWLTWEASALCVMLGIALPLLVPPIAACVWLAEGASQTHLPAVPARLPLFVTGIGLGLIGGPTLLAPLGGLSPLMILVTLAGATGFWRSLSRAMEESSPPACLIEPNRRTALCPWSAGLSLLIGLQIPLLATFVLRLMPGSAYEHYAVWSGLIAGVGGGLFWSLWLIRRAAGGAATDGPLASAVIATIWPVALLGAWGLLVDIQLTVNSSISTVGLVMAIRIAIVALATVPLGAALGRLWSPLPSATREEATAPWQLGPGAACMCLGIVISGSFAAYPAVMASLLAAAAMMAAAARYWMLGWPHAGRLGWRLAGLATVTSVALLPLVSHSYRPDLAARLLFSTHTFSAVQTGISRELLPYLDDGRLEAVAADHSSTWTLWRHRGSQLALRQNGLPRGVVSTDVLTTPQFAGEVLPAVVPLVLHERPESVLLLGVGSTASLASVLACPVKEVTCIEGDAALIGLIDGVLAPALGHHPFDDSRVRLLNVDPTLAMLAGDTTCDVLIINEAQPSVLGATSGFTTEFYLTARSALRQNGILCQRLQYADFGREPIEDLLATMRSAFPQVALIETAPGEMLILATTRPGPLVNAETLDRCQAPHIRGLMAQVGWDWSVLMNLGAIRPAAVDALASEHGTSNSIRNGRLAYTLPQEVLRWSSPQLPKWKQRQQLLSAHADRMLAWIDDDEQTKQVEQRLADVIEQQRLIYEHPDHFWAYRKSLKERLTDRPRAVIQQVRHEGLKRSLHPEDQRRRDYLEVLGEAATAESPAPEQIRRIAGFAVPYDPLLSYFLHQEAARLYEKSPADDHAARFAHLRYSIYFGPPNDQSVRNVVSALEMLNQHPGLYSDPQQRWDEMNSLLEVLKQRTALRLQSDQTASAFELVDAERSIDIARKTMAAMDALRGDVGLAAIGWDQRRIVLDRMLVQPMWKYHSQQAARLQRQHARAAAISETR